MMTSDTKDRIPKVIHYFWLGGGEKPESVKKCIDSWRKYCPDFEIKEWNESNYDVHKHPYMDKAFREKKWAFVSDYARLDVLYNYGGIYLDTDVEVIKDLSPLCEFKAYIGFENSEYVNDGQGFGCIAGLPILKALIACYEGKEPYDYSSGAEEYIECPILCTKVLTSYGLKQDGSRQKIEDVEILPVDYLCPLDYATGKINITGNTYSIHHFDASWHGKGAKKAQKLMQYINRLFGKKLGTTLFRKIMSFKDRLKGRKV